MFRLLLLGALFVLSLATQSDCLGDENFAGVLNPHTGHYFLVAPDAELNQQGSVAFSPDKKWIAYDAIEVGEPFSTVRTLITRADGSQQEPTDLCGGCMPSFSKSGKRIAVSRHGFGVVTMNLDGSEERVVNPGAWHIVFSPVDESVVAYGIGNDIQIHDLETDDVYRLLPKDQSQTYRQIIWNFQWAPDGKSIAFAGFKKVGGKVMAMVGTEEGNLRHDVLLVKPFHDRICFHPQTGELFYTTSVLSQFGKMRIFSLDPNEPKKSHRPAYFVSQPDGGHNRVGGWASDGSEFAFSTMPDSTDRKVSAAEFEKTIRPIAGAVRQLILGCELLKHESYAEFVDRVVGEVDESVKEMAVNHIADHAEGWLILLTEAIERFDDVEIDGDSIRVPLELPEGELKMTRIDGEWRLAIE